MKWLECSNQWQWSIWGNRARLLNSPNLVAGGLTVWYVTCPVVGWCHHFWLWMASIIIGVGYLDIQWIMGVLQWILRIFNVLQRPLTVQTACRCGWARRLWKSLSHCGLDDACSPFHKWFLDKIQIIIYIAIEPVIQLLAIRSLQFFAHATAAQLSCHMQNFVVITSLQFG